MMQFLNPGAFLILGIIPVLLLIHSLKPKPEKKMVTNLFIWNEVLKEQKGGFQIKRILRNISLLLQIIIIILTAIAMSSPFTINNRKAPGNAILVLDTSASMKTETGHGTRFIQAQDKALGLIESMQENSQITLIEAGNLPSVKTLKNKNKDDLTQIISKLKAKDTPGNMEKSIYLALSFMDKNSNDTIYFITDGCYSNYTKLISLHENIIPVLIQGGEKNTGITRFEFRQLPGNKEHFQVMLEVKNFTSTPVVFPFSISYENKKIFSKNIGLAEHEKKILILPFDGILSGALKAEIEAKDDFMVDNLAYGVISDNQKTWVLLVTQGNYFLEKLLSVSPDIYVNTISDIQASTWPTLVSENDIIILDGIDSPAVHKGNFLLINTIPEGLPFYSDGQVDLPEIIDQDLKNSCLPGYV